MYFYLDKNFYEMQIACCSLNSIAEIAHFSRHYCVFSVWDCDFFLDRQYCFLFAMLQIEYLSVLGRLQLPGLLRVPAHAVVRQLRVPEGPYDGEGPAVAEDLQPVLFQSQVVVLYSPIRLEGGCPDTDEPNMVD